MLNQLKFGWGCVGVVTIDNWYPPQAPPNNTIITKSQEFIIKNTIYKGHFFVVQSIQYIEYDMIPLCHTIYRILYCTIVPYNI